MPSVGVQFGFQCLLSAWLQAVSLPWPTRYVLCMVTSRTILAKESRQLGSNGARCPFTFRSANVSMGLSNPAEAKECAHNFDGVEGDMPSHHWGLRMGHVCLVHNLHTRTSKIYLNMSPKHRCC